MGMKANRVIRGVMCAAAGGIAWGFSGSCAQVLLDSYGVSALWLTCVRMQLSALLFLALALVLDRRNLAGAVRDKRSVVDIVLFGLFGVALMQVCYLSAIQHTSAGTATVVMQVGLALIMLVVCVQTRRLPRAREVAGLFCAIVGVFIIATQGNPGRAVLEPHHRGLQRAVRAVAGAGAQQMGLDRRDGARDDARRGGHDGHRPSVGDAGSA